MISLYECAHARVRDGRISCACGHVLDKRCPHGDIGIERLARGEPLELSACQGCSDFTRNGEPLLSSERGWKNGTPKTAD